MAYDIRWLGTACFQIRMVNGKTIVIDPYLDDSANAPIASNEIEACDFIFLTHGHYDHVLDVGKLVERFGADIYCSREVAEALIQHQKIDPKHFFTVSPGDIVLKEGLTVEVVRGVHVDFMAEYKRITGQEVHMNGGDKMMDMIRTGMETILGPITLPELMEDWMAKYPGGEQLNFVFDTGDGKPIYMAGSFPDPSLLDVARKTNAFMMLLQVIPGKAFQGLEEQTAEFALASGAKIIVPQHHDPLMEGAYPSDLSMLRQLLEKKDMSFVEFTPGRWYHF